jgi:hypothetical protein
MINRMWLAGVVMLAAASGSDARGRLEMAVSPSFAFAPANLVVRTTVEADQNNRAIEIVADSGEFYRSSEIQLDGDRAPRTSVFEFRDLPRGTYRVHATLKGPGGTYIAQVRSSVDVVDGGGAER